MAKGNQIAKPKRYNNYTLTVFFAFLMGLPLAIIFVLLAHLELGTLSWIANLLFPTFLFCQFLSAIRYTGRLADFIKGDNTNRKEKSKEASESEPSDFWSRMITKKNKNIFEFLGLAAGFLLATSVVVAQIALHLHPHLRGIFSAVSVFCGLGNRTGRIFDYLRDDRKKEPNYIIGVSFGLIVGIILTVTAMAVFGTSVVVGGATPFALFIFFASNIGVATSVGGYIGRAFHALLGNRSLLGVMQGHQAKNTLKKRMSQYKYLLTVIGCTLGILLAISLVSAGITTIPLFGSGLPHVLAGIFLFATCISGLGTIGNCVGDALDKLFLNVKKKKPPALSTHSVVIQAKQFSPLLDKTDSDLKRTHTLNEYNKVKLKNKTPGSMSWWCCNFSGSKSRANNKLELKTYFSVIRKNA